MYSSIGPFLEKLWSHFGLENLNVNKFMSLPIFEGVSAKEWTNNFEAVSSNVGFMINI